MKAVEFLVTFSNGALDSNSANAYFARALDFLCKKMGKGNLLGHTVHRDETTPHLSAYFIPLSDGRLNASKFFDGRKVCSEWQSEFWEDVGSKFGLERGVAGSRARHEDIKKRYAKLKELDKREKAVARRERAIAKRDEELKADEETVRIRESAVRERERKIERFTAKLGEEQRKHIEKIQRNAAEKALRDARKPSERTSRQRTGEITAER